MKTKRHSGEFISFALALLAVLAQYGPALAGGQSDPRSLSDSLSTAYALSEGEVPFDASTAKLDDYLAYAAKQSPALKAAFYEWRSALKRSGYAGALPDPWFSYTYFVDNVETRVGPQNQVFRLRQSFPWFGTLGAKKDISLEAANAAYQRFEAEKLELFYQVKTAYYEYYYLGRDIAITSENLELLTFWESVARAKYRVALKQHPDVIKAQVELGKLEDRLRTVEDMTEPVVARLRAVMNLPDNVMLLVPTEIHVEEAALDRDAIIAQVLANNPDLKSLGHLVDKAQAGKRLAGKSSWPSFFVGVDYIDVGQAINPNFPESGKDAWMASVGISLPIWFGANKARRQEAEAQYRKAQNSHADAQNRLYAFTEKIIFEYDDALRKTRLYRDGLVPKAEQSLNANYTAYQAGETDFLNLLDAQRQLLDFQLQYERSKSNLAIKRAEIEMVTGKTLPTP
ncbi:MAG: TolC family protein [Candidatus Latescibacteria bacterium]|nr:TolC family protein [Candidatus Latescibacterota bacterium]NIO29234.1 TolC family protein [Candidatus Latescibacterota bacterium]NIO56858.1 TolC family protein [Candidatus Latescibacterota bacterium]